MDIRPFRTGEDARLRDVARAAKAHWGYDSERVRTWAAGLEYAGKDVWVADEGGRAMGYATLTVDGERAELDELWVEPEWIGCGVGSELFRFVAARAAALGAARLEWEADPNAVGFYERMGARWLRDSAPSDWGRILPIMGLEL
jgi:GNAT superfamily N-acetyltransferase